MPYVAGVDQIVDGEKRKRGDPVPEARDFPDYLRQVYVQDGTILLLTEQEMADLQADEKAKAEADRKHLRKKRIGLLEQKIEKATVDRDRLVGQAEGAETFLRDLQHQLDGLRAEDSPSGPKKEAGPVPPPESVPPPEPAPVPVSEPAPQAAEDKPPRRRGRGRRSSAK
jgi:hypothetical protein